MKSKNKPCIQGDSGQPLVSVIMPVYNAADFLHQAINSILDQTHKNLELIAVNDGSTDDSLQILKTYAQKDKRLKILTNNTNLGTGTAANKGIRHANSDYIARMDADDISFPGRIKKQLTFLLQHQNVIAVGGQCRVINTKGEIVGKKNFPCQHQQIKSMMFNSMSIQQPTVMFNTKLLPKNFTWYNNSLSPVDDLDLFFRLFKYGQLANLPILVLKYRQYHQSSSLKDPKKTFALTKKVRSLAVNRYQFHPSLKNKIIAIIQEIIVRLLPSPFIYPAYSALRGITPLKANFRNDSYNIYKHFPSLKLRPRRATLSNFGSWTISSAKITSMPRKKTTGPRLKVGKIPTAEFLRKYGLPTAIIPGIILAAILGFNWQKIIEKNPRNNPDIFATNLPVQEVLDGDTIKLEKGLPIRLIGMNAPDKGQPFYNESRAFLVKLIGDKKIKVEYAKVQNDNYGRLRGYAFTSCDYPSQKFCKNGALNLNVAMVGQGLANIKETKLWHDNLYKKEFATAQQQAKTQKLNLWSN